MPKPLKCFIFVVTVGKIVIRFEAFGSPQIRHVADDFGRAELPYIIPHKVEMKAEIAHPFHFTETFKGRKDVH